MTILSLKMKIELFTIYYGEQNQSQISVKICNLRYILFLFRLFLDLLVEIRSNVYIFSRHQIVVYLQNDEYQ